MRGIIFRLWLAATLLFIGGLYLDWNLYAYYTTKSEADSWDTSYNAPWLRAAERLDAAADPDAALVAIQPDYAVQMSLVGEEVLPSSAAAQISGGTRVAWSMEDSHWLMFIPLRSGRFLQIGPYASEGSWSPVREIFTSVVFSVLALSFGLLLRPLAKARDRMIQAVRQIGEGDLGTRIQIADMRVAPEMAEAFNLMAARTEALVEAQRSVLRTASHELRTPIARLRLGLHVARSRLDPSELEAMSSDLHELDTLFEVSPPPSRRDRTGRPR